MFLKGRDLLTLSDLGDGELGDVLAFARELKGRFHAGEPMDFLNGAQLFSLDPDGLLGAWNPLVIGMAQMGGVCSELGRGGLREELGETWLDRARLLDLSGHGLAIAGRSTDSGHHFMEQFAGELQAPLINAMSDLAAPLQALASFLTLQERRGDELENARAALVWSPPGRACKPLSTPVSLAEILLRRGLTLRMACPAPFHPGAETADYLDQFRPGAIEIGEDAAEAMDGADLVFAMNWNAETGPLPLEALALMGRQYEGWRMSAELLALASEDALLGGGLPQTRDAELQASLLEGPQSIHLEENVNLLHVAKALLALILDPAIHGSHKD